MLRTHKKTLLGLTIASLFICSFTSASALTLDLQNGGDGWINEGFFSVEEMNPGGTGYIEPFVRLQTNEDDQDGTNTNLAPVLDEKQVAWINVYELTADLLFTVGGQDYVNFVLDIDEPAAPGKSTLTLTELILYTDSSEMKYPYPSQLDTTLQADWIWDMDQGTDGDSEVLLDYNYIGGGSGWWGDLSVLIPVSDVDLGKYFYLYSAFTESDNNPEEWSTVTNTAPIPEPATMLLFGTGLAGLASSRLRKKKK